MSNMFRTKHLTPDDHSEGHGDGHSGLKRCLTAFDLTLLGVGAIIGTGIFVLTGIAAATLSGPAVMLSFIIAGIACTFAALSYAELAASVGGCGSAYGYSYAAFGELFAWIIGWDLLLEYGVSVAAVANGWSGYFGKVLDLVGLKIPELWTKAPQLGGYMNLPAMLIVFFLMILLIIGAKESARTNTIAVFIKLVTIAVFIAVAAFNVHPENWSPFMPFGWFGHGADGKPIGVMAGASLVFFAYVGFDAVSTAAEEAKNPRRDLPIGIIGSLVFCTLIYIVVSGLLTGMVPYPTLNVSYPVAFALEQVGVSWASALVAAGAFMGLTTVMLVLYYGLTRILFAMGRDGLLPAYLGHVHTRMQTPVRAIVISGVLIMIIAGFIPLGELAELVNIGTLAAFVMVCAGVIVLRRTRADLPRPFLMPFHPILPVLGMLSCGALMAFLPAMTWLRFVVWLLIGLAVYFAYSIRHSKLAMTDR